jgi:anhydro-N-acetylmuramic acid kinase
MTASDHVTNMRYIAGAMSGTSADGVDVALTEIRGRGLDMTARLIRHTHRPYSEELRKEIFSFRGNEVGVDFLPRLARVGREISLSYAAAVNDCLGVAGMKASDLAAVAAHGQTLFHDPPNTIQWFDPALVAAEVGCPVVSDFRRADLAAGGQGAPLVPFADYILFRHPTKNRVLLNLGGIANITWLPAGGTPDQVIAFDTGPANCIVDDLMKPGIDVDGKLSARGAIHKPLVRDVLKSPYFDRHPPKSADGPEMIGLFRGAWSRHPDLTLLTDELATACAITAESVAQAIVRWCPLPVDEVIASGGGTKNAAIMKLLGEQLGEVPIRTTADLGVPADAKEAIAFALLAAATLDGVPSNVPTATGAKRAIVLGSITPKP